MDEDALSVFEDLVDVVADSFQVGTKICGGVVDDIDAVACEAVFLCLREPGNVNDLNYVCDAVIAKKVHVIDGREGAKVEPAGGCGGGSREGGRFEDEVHRGAHCLYNLGRHVVKANHGGRRERAHDLGRQRSMESGLYRGVAAGIR